VRANLVYRAFTRIGDGKVPDAKTLARRKLRVDTTVVETNIHYPTDSSLLGDGARVLTHTMKKIERKSGGLKQRIRDRMRAVKKRVVAIAMASRQKGPQREEQQRKQYAELLTVTRRILNQAKRVVEEVERLSPHRRRSLRPLTEILRTMDSRMRQVTKQARARIFQGITNSPEKIVSVFEPHTEIIRKGKASKPTEFGKLVEVQEAENQIITDYRVFAERPSDRELLVPAVEEHQRLPALTASSSGRCGFPLASE
jgi:hypothetical protein